MWDNEHDKKLREAAENFQPAADESAWQKMEKMLDENLPEEKDRKRILFFLPFILVTVGLLFFVLFNNNGNENSIATHVPKKIPANIDVTAPGEKGITSLTSHKNRNEKPVTGVPNTTVKSERNVAAGNRKGSDGNSNESDVEISGTRISPGQSQITLLNDRQNQPDSKPTNSTDISSATKADQLVIDSKGDKQQNKEESILHETNAVSRKDTTQNMVKQKAKTQNSFADRFTVSFSTGPTVSYVGNNAGKLTVDLGIGAGYNFSRHFSLRTGVFISKKVYSATPDEYTYPGGSAYNYLQKINADCNVIDIPLTIDYSFGRKGKHNWLVSGGLSSYLMKKESYDYMYKTPAGAVYYKNQTLSNQNKHFFSILDLSAGYEYSLSKRFSLAAQPYIDIPLTGIGAGKVKLNSAGVLFTLKAKPFEKKSR